MRTGRTCRNSHDGCARLHDVARVSGPAGVLIVAPDFDRRIDLPGPGPCPRPVDIDRSKAALADLVSLRVYSFAKGAAIDGEAEGDEVFVVLMRGAADIAVEHDGRHVGPFALRIDGAAARAIYLPPGAAYRLTAVGDCDIAYARARPRGATAWPASFEPVDGRLDVPDHATGMELMVATLPAGATWPLAGRDGGSRERFVHVRSPGNGVAAVGSATLSDWNSAILGDGEHATLRAEGGTVDVMTVSALSHRHEPSKGTVDASG